MKSTEIYEAEVLKEIKSIEEMEIGSEEHNTAIDGVTKLTEKMIDLKKIELEERKLAIDNEDKIGKRAIEFERVKREKRDQKWKNGIAIGGIVVPFLGAVWANVYNWYKESDGIMSSSGGRKAIDFLTKFGKK